MKTDSKSVFVCGFLFISGFLQGIEGSILPSEHGLLRQAPGGIGTPCIKVRYAPAAQVILEGCGAGTLFPITVKEAVHIAVSEPDVMLRNEGASEHPVTDLLVAQDSISLIHIVIDFFGFILPLGPGALPPNLIPSETDKDKTPVIPEVSHGQEEEESEGAADKNRQNPFPGCSTE